MMKKVINRKQLLDYWLRVEHINIGKRLGFITINDINITEDIIYSSLHLLDKMSLLKPTEQDKSLIISVSALMWEYIPEKFNLISEYLIKILSRIGYSPSSIIIDREYDKENRHYSAMNSIFTEASIVVNQLRNQVELNNNFYVLSDFQKEIWEKIDKNKVLGISAPTSAGKSYIILLKTIELMQKNDCDIVYIVPTLSLVNQVYSDYSDMLKRNDINDTRIFMSYSEDIDDSVNKIFVVTQEKLIDIFDSNEYKFRRKVILVVDEIQNIEHVQDDDEIRSKVLYDVLNEFKNSDLAFKIIFSGARVNDIDELANQVFNIKIANKIETKTSPVLSITYSVIKKEKEFYLRQYVSLKKKPTEILIENSNKICIGKTSYTNEVYQYISNIVKCMNTNKNIIFSPTVNQARKIALNLEIPESNIDRLLEELILYYENTVHKNYGLCTTLKNNIAYHHGKMPQHVRRTIEIAMKQGIIQNLVCTTTMIQGVNLPAQNIIVRNPYLFTKRKTNVKNLTSYEMANLRGRAGRLLKDFVGRTFVLDENSFAEIEEYDEDNLFNDTEKNIDCTYATKYHEYEDDINESLETNELINSIEQKHGFWVIYIRQTILKNPEKAKDILKNVGIELEDNEISSILRDLSRLKVPKIICSKNRYWDPLVLNKLYQDNRFKLPTGAGEENLQSKLVEILKILREDSDYSYYFEKQIPSKYRRGGMLRILCSNAEKWLKSKSLKEILNRDYKENQDISESIDANIEMLQDVVSYSLPLLLKPLYDIFEPESAFLSFLQSGSYIPVVRTLIEWGIPRETAIFLHSKYLEKVDFIGENKYDNLRNELINIKNKIPYWIKEQLVGIIY